MSTPDAAVVSALQAALQAEHRAVFGYGALGPKLAGAQAQVAYYAERAHRNQRDRTSIQLRTLSVVPSASAISYPVPALPSALAARRFARQLENAAAAAWRFVIVAATTTPPADETRPVRDAALTALTACAVRALHWAETIDAAHPTDAFPGI